MVPVGSGDNRCEETSSAEARLGVNPLVETMHGVLTLASASPCRRFRLLFDLGLETMAQLLMFKQPPLAGLSGVRIWMCRGKGPKPEVRYSRNIHK